MRAYGHTTVLLLPVSTVSARNAWDHDSRLCLCKNGVSIMGLAATQARIKMGGLK